MTEKEFFAELSIQKYVTYWIKVKNFAIDMKGCIIDRN